MNALGMLSTPSSFLTGGSGLTGGDSSARSNSDLTGYSQQNNIFSVASGGSKANATNDTGTDNIWFFVGILLLGLAIWKKT